jgi:hypothetical protein
MFRQIKDFFTPEPKTFHIGENTETVCFNHKDIKKIHLQNVFADVKIEPSVHSTDDKKLCISMTHHFEEMKNSIKITNQKESVKLSSAKQLPQSSINVENVVSKGDIVLSVSKTNHRIESNGKNLSLSNVQITVPDKVDLYLESQVSKLDSKAALGSVIVDLIGKTNIKLSQVNNLSGNLRDNSKLNVSNFQNGSLSLSASGYADADIGGSFSEISVTTSYASGINTIGPCNGKYSAVAQDFSRISHVGKIFGALRQSSSDYASVRLSSSPY